MLQIDFNNEIIKAAPIVGTAGTDMVSRLFFGLSLYEWFYVAAILYTLVQIGAKIVDIIIKWRKQDG